MLLALQSATLGHVLGFMLAWRPQTYSWEASEAVEREKKRNASVYQHCSRPASSDEPFFLSTASAGLKSLKVHAQ